MTDEINLDGLPATPPPSGIAPTQSASDTGIGDDNGSADQNYTREEEPLFTGRLEDIRQNIDVPFDTTRSYPTTDFNGMPDPRQLDMFKDILGTNKEAPTITPWLLGQFQDPKDIIGLIQSGSTDLASKLLGKGNSIEQFKNILGSIGSNLGKKSFTFEEYEKSVLPKAPNLEENLNPLGLPTQFLRSALSMLDQLDGNKDKANKEAKRLDKLRKQIYDLISDIETFRGFISPFFVKTILPKLTSNEQTNIIQNYFIKFEVIFITADVIIPGTVKDQLLDLKAFLNSFLITLKNITRSVELNTSNSQELNRYTSSLKEYTDRINNIVSKSGKDLTVLIEDIRNMRASLEPFKEKKTNQEVNYNIADFEDKFTASAFTYTNHRQSYTNNGHPSVSKLATSFSNKGSTLRDSSETIESAAPIGKTATSADGSGDKTQEKQPVETIPKNGTVGPLTQAEYNEYLDKLGKRESGNNYGRVNTIGYSGRWQFGAAALIDLGYVKPGTSVRNLKSNSVWTGKDGITSRAAWLSNSKIQDKAMLDYTRRNYKSLLRLRVITEGTPSRSVMGFLAAAHLKGPGGARKLKNGQDNKDAYGTSASSYYRMMANTNYSPSGKAPTQYDASAAERVGKNVLPDSPNIAVPMSQASPRYPYNKVRQYEGGHFKEYDSTPGNERIQEKHKTGTGYEVFSDGTIKQHVTKDRYSVILGSDYLLVSGQCQIFVKGDCGLRVEGNLNVNVGNDYNLLVGGNFNQVINGNNGSQVNGTQNVNVMGDSAEVVGGFKKVGVDGDYQQEGASQTIISRAGDVNIASKKKMNVLAVGDMNMVSSGNMNTATKGSTNISADGEMKVASKGEAVFHSTGGAASFKGESSTHLGKPSGATHITGSGLKLNQEIEAALFANRAAIAGSLGPAPPQEKTGQEGGGGKAKSYHDEAQKGTEKEKNTEIVDKFNAIKGETTHGYAGGDGADPAGYDKGIIET